MYLWSVTYNRISFSSVNYQLILFLRNSFYKILLLGRLDKIANEYLIYV